MRSVETFRLRVKLFNLREGYRTLGEFSRKPLTGKIIFVLDEDRDMFSHFDPISLSCSVIIFVLDEDRDMFSHFDPISLSCSV
jgi:hypothetical protein